MDAAVARAIVKTRGGAMTDYMPWPKEPEPVATIEGVFAMIKTAAASKKGKK